MPYVEYTMVRWILEILPSTSLIPYPPPLKMPHFFLYLETTMGKLNFAREEAGWFLRSDTSPNTFKKKPPQILDIKTKLKG